MNTDLEVFWTIVAVNVCYCTILITPKRSLVFKTYHFSSTAKQKEQFKRVSENRYFHYMCIITMYVIKNSTRKTRSKWHSREVAINSCI